MARVIVGSGTKLIVRDPRRSDMVRRAPRFLQFKPDTDVAILNAMMHLVVKESLVARGFINSRTSGYGEPVRHVDDYRSEKMASICGIDAETLREVARLYASSKASMILWGHGRVAAFSWHR